MGGGDWHVSGGPGNAVGRTTCHLTDLVTLQHHQGGLPIDGGGAIPLLSMIIVSPSKDLETMSKDSSWFLVICHKPCKHVLGFLNEIIRTPLSYIPSFHLKFFSLGTGTWFCEPVSPNNSTTDPNLNPQITFPAPDLTYIIVSPVQSQ